MADGVFNVAKGRWAEKILDSTTNVGVLLLKVAEADATLIDYDTVAAILAGANTEADFTNYGPRKTGITGVVTIDDTNNRVDGDFADQTWTSAGGATNNTLVKAIVFYQESASDSGRIPLTHHDFAETTTGSDLVMQLNAAGFIRAS